MLILCNRIRLHFIICLAEGILIRRLLIVLMLMLMFWVCTLSDSLFFKLRSSIEISPYDSLTTRSCIFKLSFLVCTWRLVVITGNVNWILVNVVNNSGSSDQIGTQRCQNLIFYTFYGLIFQIHLLCLRLVFISFAYEVKSAHIPFIMLSQ